MSDAIERCPTGIEGLDELMDGGFPKGRTILISGSCGTGKTIFGVQFLYNGAVKYDEAGVLVCLEQSPNYLKKDVSAFGFDLQNLEDKGKLTIIDASLSRMDMSDFPVPSEVPSSSFQLNIADFANVDMLIDAIITAANKIDAKRIVIDGLPSLDYMISNERNVRNTLININYKLLDSGATAILTSGISDDSSMSKYGLEEYIVDGAITLHYITTGPGSGRNLIIEKMRGTEHSEDIHTIKYKRGARKEIIRSDDGF